MFQNRKTRRRYGYRRRKEEKHSRREVVLLTGFCLAVTALYLVYLVRTSAQSRSAYVLGKGIVVEGQAGTQPQRLSDDEYLKQALRWEQQRIQEREYELAHQPVYSPDAPQVAFQEYLTDLRAEVEAIPAEQKLLREEMQQRYESVLADAPRR